MPSCGGCKMPLLFSTSITSLSFSRLVTPAKFDPILRIVSSKAAAARTAATFFASAVGSSRAARASWMKSARTSPTMRC